MGDLQYFSAAPSSSITFNVPPDFRPDVDTIYMSVGGQLCCTSHGGTHAISIKEATGDYMSLLNMGNLNNINLTGAHPVLGHATTASAWHGFDMPQQHQLYPHGYVDDLKRRAEFYLDRVRQMQTHIDMQDNRINDYREATHRLYCKKKIRINTDNLVLL